MANSFKIAMLLLVCPMFINAQTLVGIFAGYNSSKVYESASSPSYVSSYKYSPSFILGLHYKERKNNVLNLTLGFDYLKRVAETYSSTTSHTIRDIDYNIHSINFRILPEFSSGNKIQFYANFGPYFGLIITSNRSGFEEFHAMEPFTTIDYTDVSGNANEDFNAFDFGVSTTLGIEISITEKIFLLVDANYSIGINDISDGSYDKYEVKLNTKNFYATGGVVYKFDDFNLTKLFK